MLPINIGISRCLIGDLVRYDGAGKYSAVCHSVLSKNFQLTPLCPEVESGLTIPRPPIELIKYPKGVKVLGRDDRSIDVTDQLKQYCDKRVLSLNSLSGFILTPRSPSCGLNTVSIKSPNGDLLSGTGMGYFTKTLSRQFAYLPLIEEPSLANARLLLLFQIRVIFYHFIKEERWFTERFINDSNYATLISHVKKAEPKKNKLIAVNNGLNYLDDEQLKELLTLLRENLDE